MGHRSAALEKLLDPLYQEILDLSHEIINNDPARKKLEISLLALLRFLPLEEVTQFVNTIDNPFAMKIYEQVKSTFIDAGPYFSRYSDPKDLGKLTEVYYAQGEHAKVKANDLKEHSQRDIRFGMERRKLAEDLLKRLKSDKQRTFAPQTSVFQELPASADGSRRVAAIMELVAAQNYERQVKSKSPHCEQFRKLRPIDGISTSWTCIGDRYAWGETLTQAVLQYSQSKEARINKPDKLYKLTYPNGDKDIEVNSVELNGRPMFWFHGKAPLSSTWGAIEDLFEQILAMDLSKAGKEKMREFYSDVAELVWLIGNSQPMNRGSGSVAEIILAVVHRHHGLKPPILKLGFPQLDVLDISFPVDDYRYMFPYFFEPGTLPPALRLDPLKPGQTVAGELQEMYTKRNEDPAAQCDQIKRRVCRELNVELFRLNKKPLNERDRKRYNSLNQLKSKLTEIPVDASRKDCKAAYIKGLDEAIKESLADPALDKYQGLRKLGKRLANVGIILTFPFSMPVKWLTTGSVLFSTEGKSKAAARKAHKILKGIRPK